MFASKQALKVKVDPQAFVVPGNLRNAAAVASGFVLRIHGGGAMTGSQERTIHSEHKGEL